MSGRLLGRTVPVSGLNFALGDTANVGAASENQVCLLAPGVADLHARIWSESGLVWLEDAGSETGTFLNGDRLAHKELVHHLDVISFGHHVDLIFVSRDEQPAADWIQAASVDLLEMGADRRIELPKGELTFGRGSSCDVVLPSPSISKVHARLRRTSNQVILQDLESVNGTLVNGTRIEAPAALSDGDVVSLGGHPTFKIAISTPEEPGGPATSLDNLAGAKTRSSFEQWELDARNASAAATEDQTPPPSDRDQ